MRARPVILAIGVCALAGAATALARSTQTAEKMLDIVIVDAGSDLCVVRIGETIFTLPKDGPAMTATLRQLHRRGRAASIGGSRAAPYRCIGGVIYLAQQAGFERIDMVARPQPPKAKSLTPR